jgi:hypothetical protein
MLKGGGGEELVFSRPGRNLIKTNTPPNTSISCRVKFPTKNHPHDILTFCLLPGLY